LNLSEIYGFFWIQRREEERVWLSNGNVVANWLENSGDDEENMFMEEEEEEEEEARCK
jgi:hypothetical protein